MDNTKLIEKAALINAVQHKGKADEKAVLGRVRSHPLEKRGRKTKNGNN